MKRYISLLTAVLLVLCALSACGIKGENGENDPDAGKTDSVKETTLKLSYYPSEDFDPFSAKSETNLQIMGLVYDGLYKLDKNYEPVPEVAKSAAAGASSINITLNDRTFSDGSPVTASDVSYSFSLAKESPAYSKRLANFESVDITAENMLIFHLSSPDVFALSCLTFPIVRNGSEGAMPIGCGRYAFKDNGDTVYLVVNTYRQNFKPTIKNIVLEPITDSSSVESSLEIGNIGFYYNDLSGGSFARINAKTVDMGINNFVYIGFNYENEFFENPDVRKAINLAIDRKGISGTAFQGHARETYTPFNPDWYTLASKDLIITRDTAAAALLLQDYADEIADMEISVLVNKENAFKLEAAESAADSLTALGFDVTVKDYDPEYYLEALEIGSYDLYIGEYRLTPNMDLNPLFDGTVGTGISEDSASAARYSQLLAGECELMDFINTFNDDVPFIPLCYRNAASSYTNSMSADFACCDSDVFYDIETWKYK